jgi:hypothetical protein
MKDSPYFEIGSVIEINNISELLDLNKEKTYKSPGELWEREQDEDNKDKRKSFIKNNVSRMILGHNTSGLFRGQYYNWPLLPSIYRNNNDNSHLNKFYKIAAEQNLEFSRHSKIDQMTIAQHYGLNTPLLDWTTNIFVALYFSIYPEVGANRLVEDFTPCIYHMPDERCLNNNTQNENLELIKESFLVKPLPIDRRVERQFSAFTLHPLPSNVINKIMIYEYRLINIIEELWNLMKGLGFSPWHYFPDYAGIVENIKKDNTF